MYMLVTYTSIYNMYKAYVSPGWEQQIMLVASIVALLSNGYKQRFHWWLLTYSVHVTILFLKIKYLENLLIDR
jgi:hypothetical protein